MAPNKTAILNAVRFQANIAQRYLLNIGRTTNIKVACGGLVYGRRRTTPSIEKENDGFWPAAYLRYLILAISRRICSLDARFV
jgi:hypothetical protein